MTHKSHNTMKSGLKSYKQKVQIQMKANNNSNKTHSL